MQPFDPTTISLSGPHLVEASAGTGKTYAITTLYLRLILERDLKVEQILVVTFTEAATAELKDRIRSRLRQALDCLDPHRESSAADDPILAQLLSRIQPLVGRRRLQAALHGFDEAAIFTIHAFCMRMLKDSAFESGLPFDAELITSQQQMLEQIACDFWVRERHDRFPFEVAHLDSKVSLGKLCKLAAIAAENPGIPLLPEHGAVGLDKSTVEAHKNLYLELRACWFENLVEIKGLLDEALEKRTLKGYRRDWLDSWLEKLAAFFQAEALHAPNLPNKFEKFTTSGMVANKGKVAPTHLFFERCEAFHASHERLCASLQTLVEKFKLDLIAEVWKTLPSQKETHNQLYFQDLLHYLDSALHGQGGDLLAWIIGNRFPAALIDEFQDTDEVQYRIFRRLFLVQNKTLFLIGDPKQAIYGFRGADIYTYLEAALDTAEHCYTMNTNWRSDPQLIRSVNHLFLDHANPFLFDRIGYPEVGAAPEAENHFQHPEQLAPLHLTYVPKPEEFGDKGITREWTDKNLPKMVATRIAKLLVSGAEIKGEPVEPGHIAVLVRTNAQAQHMRDALSRYQIPCVLQGNTSVFQTEDARDLEFVLRAVAEPTRSRKVKVALCTHLLGCSANDIMAMEEDPTRWEDQVKRFRRWRDIWQNQGFIQMFRALIAAADVQRRLFSSNEGERAMTNLLHLAELLQEASNREHLGPAGLLTWFQKQRDVALAEEMAYELRLESDARAVAVVTIHRSKGLEYPIVFCPYLWEGVSVFNRDAAWLYHHPERRERVLDLREESAKEAQKQVREEEFAERLRLLYVALTRACHYVEIAWGPFHSCGGSPLGYLLFGRDGNHEASHLRSLHKKDVEMYSDLARLVNASGGRWSLGELDIEERGSRYVLRESTNELYLRRYRRKLPPSRRNSSFSQLTANSDHSELLPVKDHDAFAPELQEAPRSFLERASEAIPLRDFPKGARAGIFFHSVFEHADFSHPDPIRLDSQVDLELRKAGFDSRWQESVSTSLRRVLETPLLAGDEPRLEQIPLSDRLDEMEFLFPVALASGKRDDRLTAQKLAQVFRDHGAAVPSFYPDQLAKLGFTPLCGYMKGYIDLIFRFQGRWYLVDYKSNYLGGTFADYANPKLPAHMAESHYYLQYHIYTVALHRYLSQSLPGYDYRAHFGGVMYLFIKGMDPELGNDFGVFFDQPHLELIEALSQLMGETHREVGV